MSFKQWHDSHWSRHSLILLGGGCIYIGLGVGFIEAPSMVSKDPSLKVALHYLTMTEWGIIYIICGSLAMLASLWPIGKKVWGYMLLTAISIAWCAFYATAVWFEGAPKLTYISALIWGLLAFVWWGVSGLISLQHLHKIARREYPDD